MEGQDSSWLNAGWKPSHHPGLTATIGHLAEARRYCGSAAFEKQAIRGEKSGVNITL
jgi:hypothetical protein